MALYLLPSQKTLIQHVVRASNEPKSPGIAPRNALATPALGEADIEVLLAESPHTKWDRVKGVLQWM